MPAGTPKPPPSATDPTTSTSCSPAPSTPPTTGGRRWPWSRSGRVPVSTAGTEPIVIRVKDPGTGQLVEKVTTVDDFGAYVAAALVERDSTFTRHHVTIALTGMLRHTLSTRAVERLTDVVLAQPHFVPLPQRPGQTGGWEHRWTSRHLLDVETSLLSMLQPEPGRSGTLDEAAVNEALDAVDMSMLGPDQVDMVRRVTTQGLPGRGRRRPRRHRQDLRHGRRPRPLHDRRLPARRRRPLRPRRPRPRRRSRHARLHHPALPAPRRPRTHVTARRRGRRSRHGRHHRLAPDHRRRPSGRRQGDPRR